MVFFWLLGSFMIIFVFYLRFKNFFALCVLAIWLRFKAVSYCVYSVHVNLVTFP